MIAEMWVPLPVLSGRKQPMLFYDRDCALVMGILKELFPRYLLFQTTVVPVTQEESREEWQGSGFASSSAVWSIFAFRRSDISQGLISSFLQLLDIRLAYK